MLESYYVEVDRGLFETSGENVCSLMAVTAPCAAVTRKLLVRLVPCFLRCSATRMGRAFMERSEVIAFSKASTQ